VLLLKVFSNTLDENSAAGKPPPRLILDVGCGAGIIGICAASAVKTARVRCQDRDELARLVTAHNAAKNGIPAPALEAFTEPLLAGPSAAGWDFILTNIPAKAGKPVLENFVRRSASLLNPDGRAIMVAVHTLADFFREQIMTAEAMLISEIKGNGHNVFVYGKNAEGRPPLPPEPQAGLVGDDTDFFSRHPFYVRTAAHSRIEDISVSLETIHGASGFDERGGAVLAAAKLAPRIGLRKLFPGGNGPLLIHEPGQGFFPCWLLEFLRGENCLPQPLILSGRNILALEAARHNAARYNGGDVQIIPAADLHFAGEALLKARGGQKYCCIAAFPELLPQSVLSKAALNRAVADNRHDADQLAALWRAMPPLLVKGGVFIAAFGSSDAERFERKKPSGFTRLGTIKRNGFRADAFRHDAETNR
jgi:hypothetical protein